MENKKVNNYSKIIKNVLSLKRTKVTLYIAAVLWVAVATQIVVNRVFKEDFQITEAFVKTNTEEMKSSIEVVAEYNSDILSETDKKDIIKKMAEAIGLKVDHEITEWKDDTRSEYYFYKQAKQANSEIKVISVEQEKDSAIKLKHYIIVKLNILQSIGSIDRYKDILENTLDRMDIKNKQITMQYEGNQEGNLSKKEKNEIASMLVKELHGEIALEYDEGDLYTVYAYTGMINEYILSMDCKINIQIAITYNELTNKTRITMATPVLNQSW